MDEHAHTMEGRFPPVFPGCRRMFDIGRFDDNDEQQQQPEQRDVFSSDRDRDSTCQNS